MKSLRAWALACAVAAGAAVAGCGSAGGISTTTAPTTNNTAVLRLVNGSPDLGAVSMYVNGTPIFTNITYGQITPFYLVSSGTAYTINVYAAGTTGPDLITPAKVTFNNGDTQTIALVGHQAAPATLTAQTFIEPKYSSTTAQFAVRFHHASPLAPANMYFGVFTPNPASTATVAPATATPVATATPTPASTAVGVATPVPSITPFPAPTGTGFQQLTTAPVTYGSAANVQSVVVVSSPQPLGFFASSVAAGTAYCDPYSTCANKLGPNGIFAPVNLDATNSSNTLPYAANYHLSIFLIDATPPYKSLLTAAFD